MSPVAQSKQTVKSAGPSALDLASGNLKHPTTGSGSRPAHERPTITYILTPTGAAGGRLPVHRFGGIRRAPVGRPDGCVRLSRCDSFPPGRRLGETGRSTGERGSATAEARWWGDLPESRSAARRNRHAAYRRRMATALQTASRRLSTGAVGRWPTRIPSSERGVRRAGARRAKERRSPALYREYVPRIHAFAYRRTNSREVAEDVTAATFERAYRQLARFEWRGGGFGAWLFRIASNELTDHYRRQQRTPGRPGPDGHGGAAQPLRRRRRRPHRRR